MSIEKTLDEREKIYGDFSSQSRISQEIKDSMRLTTEWELLDVWGKESLDMIASKIGRILNSKAGSRCVDNWHDIAGYATLTERLVKQRLDYEEDEEAEEELYEKLKAENDEDIEEGDFDTELKDQGKIRCSNLHSDLSHFCCPYCFQINDTTPEKVMLHTYQPPCVSCGTPVFVNSYLDENKKTVKINFKEGLYEKLKKEKEATLKTCMVEGYDKQFSSFSCPHCNQKCITTPTILVEKDFKPHCNHCGEQVFVDSYIGTDCNLYKIDF